MYIMILYERNFLSKSSLFLHHNIGTYRILPVGEKHYSSIKPAHFSLGSGSKKNI